MKEDILEQIMEDYFVAKPGFFVKHNIKFRPNKEFIGYIANQDSVHSDIDILALNVNEKDCDRVFAVTCKSWQGGFNAKMWLDELEKEVEEHDKKSYGREKWKYFRELVVGKWTDAFIREIENQTGSKAFTYIIACTRIVNNRNNEIQKLEQSKKILGRFASMGAKVNIKVLTFDEIVRQYRDRIKDKETNAIESTEIGRLLQLISSSGVKINCD